jgi:uncharacterized membrane protein
MTLSAAAAGRVAAFALIVLAPLAIHAAIATARWTELVVLIPAAQLLILGAIAAMRNPSRTKWLAPIGIVAGIGLVMARRAGISLTLMPGVPHALAYASFLIGFGYTLLPGHEAILTRVVGAVRGPLPPEMILHTRRVTFAWCCFFAGQLLFSLLLYLYAPLEAWSFFINVLNLPLVVLMFVLEGLYRLYRFRDFPLDSVSDIIRVIAKTTERRTRGVDVA